MAEPFVLTSSQHKTDITSYSVKAWEKSHIIEYNREIQKATDEFIKLGYSQQDAAKYAREMVAANRQSLTSFQGLSDTMGKAILKVTVWMTAVGMVIGAMRKVGEVIQLWRDLEVTLERIGITTGEVGSGLYKYFEQTADVAISMGMPIESTLKGMDLALRATASLENQVQRTATATLMLRDAAVLGNVAGMSFDQAIDILVGSLRQTGMELNQGIILLDKWVAVAKNAAVSVNDLSQGFAIMSSAAASAGLNIDQVNGIITALSEAVTLGPVEVGNAVRALMSTIYNEGSIKTMARYGVAVRDATGELRSFWDIMTQLSSMVSTGALDESQILEIAKAAGAGQRRYAQFVALLKNWDAAMRASAISAEAQGEALTANERIVNTLTNAYDQFTAAQNKFWYALGEKSGIIDDMTKSLQAFANVFNMFSGINDNLFRTVKVLAEIGIALAAIKLSAVGLTKLGIGTWLQANVAPLFGMRAMAAGAIAQQMGIKTDALGRYHAPSGGVSLGGRQYLGGQILPTAGVQGLGGTRAAWGRAGAFMTTPQRGIGTMMAGAVGGTIAMEVTQSQMAGIGGGIGAAIGMALGGPAGAAAGGAIGAVIAKAIEDSAKTVEERVAEGREAFLESLSPAVRDAVTKGLSTIDFSGFVGAKVGEVTTTYADQIKLAQDEIKKNQELAARGGTNWDIMTSPFKIIRGEVEALKKGGIGAWSDFLFGGGSIDKLHESVEVYEQLVGINEFALKVAQEREEAAKKGLEDEISLTDSLALRAKELREELETGKNVNEAVNRIKREALNLTQEELETQLSQTRATEQAYSNILARFEEFAPNMLNEFKDKFKFEDFMQLSPGSYQPLLDAFATIEDSTTAMSLGSTFLEEMARNWMPIEGHSAAYSDALDEIIYQQSYWNALEEGLVAKLPEAEVELDKINTFLLEQNKIIEALTLEDVTRIANNAEMAKQYAQQRDSLAESAELAKSLLGNYTDYISKYREPGTLAYLNQGTTSSQIQEALTHVMSQIGDYLSEDQRTLKTFYAFAEDEQGKITGLIDTFKVPQEVWNQAIGYLRGIQDNTSKMLEAEYNLPSDYARPGRYWAMKSLASKGIYEFGPMQQGLWSMWQEFVQQNSMQTGGDVQSTGAYYLHKGETVTSSHALDTTNRILSSSYQIFSVMQNYLSSINLGITGLRHEIMSLKEFLGSRSTSGTNSVSSVFRAGDVSVPTFGSKGLL